MKLINILLPLAISAQCSDKSQSTGKFLHMTDIHIDPNYLQNATLESLCHRKNGTNITKVGKFGAQGSPCDSPIALIQSVFDELKSNFSDMVDFVIDTGDIVRHDRDIQKFRTAKNVLDDHIQMVHYYNSTFNLTRVKIIPTIGNNDELRHNLSSNETLLYKDLVDIWKPYSLNLTKDFLKFGSYYSDVIPGKLRIFSLNTLLWYNKNKLVKDCSDEEGLGLGQLNWLERHLEDLSRSNGKAMLTGHIGPRSKSGGLSYYDKCNELFTNLVANHSDVILGQYYGHTNLDSLTIIGKNATTNRYQSALIGMDGISPQIKQLEPISVITTGPSIIPVYNPSLRVFTYETNPNSDLPQGTPLTYDQYYADLQKGNEEGQLRWELEYNTKSQYKLNSLTISEWKQFLPKLYNNTDGMYDHYKKYITVNSDLSIIEEST